MARRRSAARAEDDHEFATAVPEPPGADEPGWTKVDADRPTEKIHPRRFVVHLVVAFAAGALLLGIAAVVASMTSNGSVALLEIRGLARSSSPARAAIVVFSLMRTGPRAQGDRRRRTLQRRGRIPRHRRCRRVPCPGRRLMTHARAAR